MPKYLLVERNHICNLLSSDSEKITHMQNGKANMAACWQLVELGEGFAEALCIIPEIFCKPEIISKWEVKIITRSTM